VKLLSVVSARPNFVKLAAIHHAVKEDTTGTFEHVIVHTGQHYDPLLSEVFFEELRIDQPHHNLGIHGGTREEVIDRTKEAILPVLKEEQPDVVLVYGDVNGAVGAVRAAKELSLRVAHVEAGLRSGDLSMPEEHNRIEIDRAADLLFCSELSGIKHLEAEQVQGKAVLVGNTMIDTLHRMDAIFEDKKASFHNRLAPLEGLAVATIHRPSNVDDPAVLKAVMAFLAEVSESCPLFLPSHPRLKKSMEDHGIEAGKTLVLGSPLPYLDFLYLVRRAPFILTDSGGIQEEATYLRKRCFTLRRNTERPSTIESGSNILIDPEDREDRKIVLDYAKHPVAPLVNVPKLWDGKAGSRILEALA
jgi:UDP-N-acetylglucosamine 2-epimerase (non-hydrolysing)